jgi:hypothetical protein
MPQRIQRKRTKGWKMPEGAVYVGRPTVFGNPWMIGQQVGPATPPMTRQQAADNYRKFVIANAKSPEQCRLPLSRLRGKDLACWCRLDQPCHADVLLEIANAEVAA